MIKELSQDLVLFLAVRLEELFELSLGQHDDLPELVLIQPDDLRDPLIHPGAPLDGACLARFLRGLGEHRIHGAPGILIFGAPLPGKMQDPLHFIVSAVLGELQDHLCIHRAADQIAVHHARLPVLAAGFTVKGEDDGIKNGGLPRAGISGDQEKPAV